MTIDNNCDNVMLIKLILQAHVDKAPLIKFSSYKAV